MLDFVRIFIALSIVVLTLSIFFGGYGPDSEFKDFTLPPLPTFTGPLAQKQIKGAERLMEGQILGPESPVMDKDAIYACLVNSRCVKVVNNTIVKTVYLTMHKDKCDGSVASYPWCGRPLGLRRKDANTFLCIDAVFGIYSINFETEKSELIFSTKNKVNGRSPKFADDLDFIDNDTVVFTDASQYGPETYLPVVSLLNDGRVITLKLSTGETKVIADDLCLPNGINVHPDRQSVLVTESCGACVTRIYFAGPKKGLVEPFSENLPGLPDNIRLAADNRSFYLAFFELRHEGTPSSVDYLAPKAWLRYTLVKLYSFLPNFVYTHFIPILPKYGFVIELDLNGNVINNYYDPDGKVIYMNTQVVDVGDKYLYFGSWANNFIGRALKH